MSSLHDWVRCRNNGSVPLMDVNYLAHFLLADPDPALMFGNFIGDGVKGSDFSSFSNEVIRGIKFHRFIDTYTDKHLLVHEAKRFFYPTQAKYSGVVVDVLFDHLLALHWTRFSSEDFDDFVSKCYGIISEFYSQLPPRSEGFYNYMVANNILVNYGEQDGLERVFRGMDSRTKFPSNMLDSVSTLESNFEDIEAIFLHFFPDLMAACDSWKTEN